MKPPLISEADVSRFARLDFRRMLELPHDEHFIPITEMACDILGVPAAFVLLDGVDRTWLTFRRGPDCPELDPRVLLAVRGLEMHEPRTIPDTRAEIEWFSDPLWSGDSSVRFLAWHPISFEGQPIGALCLMDHVPRELSQAQREILRKLSKWVENEFRIAALSEAQANLLAELEEARRESYVDALTKLWNRRGADRLLVDEIERARRRNEPVALMMIDIDHFKSINDRHGHAAGDEALRGTAGAITSIVRPYDIIARLGGDEMLVFAANCPAQLAVSLANRIAARVADRTNAGGMRQFQVTLSIGVYAGPVDELGTMLAQADAALYAAKGAGRNCVRLSAASAGIH